MTNSIRPKEFILGETQFKMLCLIQKKPGITAKELLELMTNLKSIRSVTYSADKLHEKGLIRKERGFAKNKNTYSLEIGVKVEK